jgi:HlyD family secretion protein
MRRVVVILPNRTGLKFFVMFLVAGIAAAVFILRGPLTPPVKASGRLPEVSTEVSSGKAPEVSAPAAPSIALASPGRIEGESDPIELGAAVDGVIRSIRVREGQYVSRDQVVAELDCDELEAEQPIAKTEVEIARQKRELLLRGSRQEEREAAAQKTAAAKAVSEQASSVLERNRVLLQQDEISRAVYEEAVRNANVAAAEYEGTKRHEQLLNAGPLPEEINAASAAVEAADQRVNLGEEKLKQCTVRAPIDGTILRILRREGEPFSISSGHPILTLANLAGRRVRAEVDERDLGRVHIGQKIAVYSDAFSGRRFQGAVSSIAVAMGRKTVNTGDPADKADRDILEVTARLQSATELPVGLRVSVEFVQ